MTWKSTVRPHRKETPLSNSKAKAIQRLYKRPFDYASAFDKALNDYPTTQTFVIVTTKDPEVFSFVPKHLRRFTPSFVQLGTIDRPEAGEKTHIALTKKIVDMLDTLEPKYQMDSLIYSILDYKIRENLVETFYLANLIVRGASTSRASYKDQAIAINDSLKNDFVKTASQQLEKHKAEYAGAEYAGIDLYSSLEDLNIDINNELPYVTLDGDPINENVIWSWIEKQGLNPDNTGDGEAIVDKLVNLALNNQSVVGIANTAAKQVIDDHQNDINKLHSLVLNN